MASELDRKVTDYQAAWCHLYKQSLCTLNVSIPVTIAFLFQKKQRSFHQLIPGVANFPYKERVNSLDPGAPTGSVK